MEEFSPNNHLGYFTFENATAIAQSSDHFPVDFDDAWQWLGFSRKDNAKQSLINAGFLEGQDFRVFLNNQENPQGGRKPEQIRLSVDCFKSWCMMANTERGKQVRQYYLECEKLIKSQLSDPKLLIEREKTERERVKAQAKLDELRLKHELKLAELEHKQQSKRKTDKADEKVIQLSQRSQISLSDEILKLVSGKDKVATRWIVDSLILRYGIKADTPRDRKNLELIIKKVLQQNGWIKPSSGRVTIDGKQDRGYEQPKHRNC